MWPGISVIIPTYNRAAIVMETIYRLRHNLKYEGHIHIAVGVDGTDGTWECLTALLTLNKFSEQSRKSLRIMRGPRIMATRNAAGRLPGLGANLNLLIEQTTSKYLFQMDDDHWLDGELDLTPHVIAMERWPQIGWVRLMGVSAHRYTATMYENYWYVDWNSAEVYIPSNRPHLKQRAFHDMYGVYPTYQTMGDTEEQFGHQCKTIAAKLAADKRLDVTVPVSLHEEIWQHVGDSWQGAGE